MRGALALCAILAGVIGCGWFRARPLATSESVTYAAHAEIVAPGDSVLLVRVVAKNYGSLTWTLQLGHCSMSFRVVALTPAVAQQWDYKRWSSAVNPRALCLDNIQAYRLPPGTALSSPDLERTVRIRDVLGDSMPPGRYRVTAFVDFNNLPSGDIAAGEIELRALPR